LLEKESIGQEIEVSIVGNSDANYTGKVPLQAARERSLRWTIQAIQTEQARTVGRVQSIRAHAETLKHEIRRKRADVNHLKSRLKQRRSDAESAKFQLGDRRHLALSNIQNPIKRTEHLWHSLHTKTAESRIFLCREAANLYRLQQKARRKNNSIVESYWIGGVQVVDLKELHGTLRTVMQREIFQTNKRQELCPAIFPPHSQTLLTSLSSYLTTSHFDYPPK
jgi:chromosome segregation ATPase